MIKSLQILFGLVLILVLAYVAFLDVSTKIKDDLLRKTKVMFSENNIKDIRANMKGEGLTLSRTLVLRGTVLSEIERIQIVRLSEDIEGLYSIHNQIKLQPVVLNASITSIVPKASTTVMKVPVVEISTEPIIIKNIPKELSVAKSDTKSMTEIVAEKKEPIMSMPSITMKVPVVPEVETRKLISPVSTSKMNISIPVVPIVDNKSIIVPTPVRVISVPKVVEVEKIKLEGVK